MKPNTVQELHPAAVCQMITPTIMANSDHKVNEAATPPQSTISDFSINALLKTSKPDSEAVKLREGCIGDIDRPSTPPVSHADQVESTGNTAKEIIGKSLIYLV